MESHSALQGAACQGCPVSAPHMNPPHSSFEALFFSESRAKKLPSPVAEIQSIKTVSIKETSQMDHFLATIPLPTPSLSTTQTPQHRTQQ